MSLPAISPYKDGKLNGSFYVFNQGDILPMHTHDADTVHNTFVISGEIEAYGPDRIWSGVFSPGAVISFSVGQWHEFVATKPNTKILNLIK